MSEEVNIVMNTSINKIKMPRQSKVFPNKHVYYKTTKLAHVNIEIESPANTSIDIGLY